MKCCRPTHNNQLKSLTTGIIFKGHTSSNWYELNSLIVMPNASYLTKWMKIHGTDQNQVWCTLQNTHYTSPHISGKYFNTIKQRKSIILNNLFSIFPSTLQHTFKKYRDRWRQFLYFTAIIKSKGLKICSKWYKSTAYKNIKPAAMDKCDLAQQLEFSKFSKFKGLMCKMQHIYKQCKEHITKQFMIK